MTLATKKKLRILARAGIVMAFGLILFKYIPMALFGNDILFDASAHITVASFILYTLWFFVDQNKKWQVPFIFFAIAVIIIISIQRILVEAHNDIGLLGGLILSISAIIYSQKEYFHKKITF